MNYVITFGNHSAIWGKTIINAIATASHARKGKAPRYRSPVVVSGGATLFITNRTMPKGGVVAAISTLISIKRPNHTGSKPRLATIGI